jgi:hypothetical protein
VDWNVKILRDLSLGFIAFCCTNTFRNASRRLRTQIYLSERQRANKKAKKGTDGNLEFRSACCGAQKQRRESGAMQRMCGNSTPLQRTMPRPLQKTHSIEP